MNRSMHPSMNRLMIAVAALLLIASCGQQVEYQDAQTKVIERPSPLFPIEAARNNIEGYVRLSFDINEKGETENIDVIEANPIKTFTNVAIDAVSKWKYEPLIVDGKPQVQKNVAVQLDFALNTYLGSE